MIIGMICTRELKAYYYRHESLVSIFPKFAIMNEAEEREGDQHAKIDLDEVFGANLAERFRSVPDGERVEIAGHEFIDEYSYPRTLPVGFFLYANYLDWTENKLSIIVMDYLLNSWMPLLAGFDLFDTLRWGDFNIVIHGLSFERSAIEMLQPALDLENIYRDEMQVPVKRGRPRSWDWDAASAHLISVAQQPDGLPTGASSQAKIERLVADWFLQEVGDAPATSQIRQHVVKVMRALKKPESP